MLFRMRKKRCELHMEDMKSYEEELFTEIAKLTQRKYAHMNEVLRLTQEMTEGLSRDDKVTVQMLLGMRGDELEAITDCNGKIELLLQGAEGGLQDRMRTLLKGQLTEEAAEHNMADVIRRNVQKTNNVLSQTIELDKRMSFRLAGESSFYNK